MTPTKKVYEGFIGIHSHGEADDILFITGHNDPLAEIISEDIYRNGRFLTVRYFISDQKHSIEELQEDFIRKVMGVSDAKFCHRYSEITGYLWTDEKLKVGGHDLITELKSYENKFLYLEIEFHREGLK